MASSPILQGRPASPAKGAWPDIPPAIITVAAVLMLGLINPFGYQGGGGDDWYYLEAARCAVASHALCIPDTHWAARLPLIAEMAGGIALLGDSRVTLAIIAMSNAMICGALLTSLIQKQFGRLEAVIGGLAFVVTPIFIREAVAIDVDMVELALLLASLLALQAACHGRSRRLGGVAGALLAFAIMARTTACAIVPILALAAALLPPVRRQAPAFLAGLLCLLAIDAVLYAFWTGDPFRDWRLALHHARIPSSELDTPLRIDESPLLNRHLISGWHRPMGIHVHWTVDGLLNLLADPRIGMTLATGLLLLAAEHRRADRATWLLAAAAACDFTILTYGLAIDPKPRMFLVVLAAMAALLGILGARLWRGRARWPGFSGSDGRRCSQRS